MKEILLVTILISILISVNSAYACISVPEVILAEECSGYGTPSFSIHNILFGNKTIIIERLQQHKNYTYTCGTINLTDNDIETIADFLSNGYSALRETPDEYQEFLENANEVNNNLSTCDYYSAVAYKNGWTGYVFNDESEKTEACAQAPRKLCGDSGPTNLVWNDLPQKPITTSIFVILLNYWWLFVIIIVIALIGIIYKSKKS